MPQWTYRSWQNIQRSSLPARPRSITIVVSRLSDIPDRSIHGVFGTSTVKHLLFTEGLPVEAVASRLSRLGIRDARRLHVAHESEPDEIFRIVCRLIQGNAQTQRPQFIVDAWVEGDQLVLLSPAFDRLSVPVEKLKSYIGNDPAKWPEFEIDEDGSFLYWKHADAHFGWEQFQTLVDPAALLAAEQKARAFNQRYWRSDSHTPRKGWLEAGRHRGANRPQSGAVSNRGQIPATKATLTALARAHGLQLDAYLVNLATQMKAAGSR